MPSASRISKRATPRNTGKTQATRGRLRVNGKRAVAGTSGSSNSEPSDPAPATSNHVDDDGEDELTSEASVFESDIDDYSDGEYVVTWTKRKAPATSSSSKGSSKQPPKKRPKKSEKGAYVLVKFKKMREQKARIKGFPFMNFPLDVVYEVCYISSGARRHLNKCTDYNMKILSFLSPRDMIGLLSLNKKMNSILVDGQSNSTWKCVREAYEGIPDPIPGMAEHNWARLLFSPLLCQVSCLRITLPRNYILNRDCF
jgi:hypothetical protein